MDNFDKLNITIDERHYDYIDRTELSSELQPDQLQAALDEQTAWMQKWEDDYKPQVKKAIEYLADNPVSNVVTATQSAASPSISQAPVSDGSQASIDGLEAALSQLSVATNQQRPPAVQVPLYNGDPRNFNFFYTLFDELIAKVCPTQRIKLAQLLCYVTGPALEAIYHALSYPPDTCYDQAIAILKERFGNKTEIARIALEDLYNGPLCSTSSDLNFFIEELNNTKRQVDATVYAHALSSHEAIDKLLIRLPSDVQNR